MPNKWTIAIPETPSPNYVIVKNIALESTESTVKEFFLFCGKIKEFEMKVDEDDEKHQVALINFERESAAKTAALLSNALIDDSHIVATPYFDVPGAAEKEASPVGGNEEHENQESKPKTKILAEILANGYLLQDQVVAKGVDYDNKYHVSSRWHKLLNAVQTNVKQFDEKYRIWDKAVNLDQKYKITENVNKVTQTAQEKATQALQTGLQSTTGQKAKGLADKTLHQIAAVHYEAKRIQGEKIGTTGGAAADSTTGTQDATTVNREATASSEVKPDDATANTDTKTNAGAATAPPPAAQ